MRFDYNTQPSPLLQYWVKKTIITNAVIKYKNKNKNKKLCKSNNDSDKPKDDDEDIDLSKIIFNCFYKFIKFFQSIL
jgi:hypothetical protein